MIIASIVMAILASASAPASSVTKQKMPCASTNDACIDRLIAHPPVLTSRRLPPGYKIGRCLLVIDSRTLINGRCAYSMAKGGDFHIDGPRQVFDGIDYPKADIMAAMISTDWWADVFHEDGGWTGYSNSDDNIGSVHGQGSRWGRLTRSGACYFNKKGGEVQQQVHVCLWKT